MGYQKIEYKCKVNGCLGPNAMCRYIGCANNRCFAHGNTKCEHKEKQLTDKQGE